MRIAKKIPLVSIGLPVYNGENYLDQAIESVLNQSYPNLELIISDNGSDDGTAAICQKYMEMDERIRYHRFDKNYGASLNFNKSFRLSSGKYFKWLAHDDKLMPDNIRKSVEILENNEDVVLCMSAKMNIGAHGDIIDMNNYHRLHLTEENMQQRFASFLKCFSGSFASCDFVMGLIRADILKQTHLIRNFSSADFTLLAELILKGKFFVINEPLFQRRIHHAISTSIYNENPDEARKLDTSVKIRHRSHAEIMKWFDPSAKTGRIPHLIWLVALLRSINDNEPDQRKRKSLYLSSYRWFFYRSFWSLMYRFRLNPIDTRKFSYKSLKTKRNESISYRT